MSKRKTATSRNKRAARATGETAGGSVRRAILAYLKKQGGGLVADVAAHVRITYEGARQHLTQLEKENLVEKQVMRPARVSAGRPVARYALTGGGDHLFPKRYDDLTVELIDALAERLGGDALKQVLAAFTEKRVHDWAQRLEGKSLKERVAALQEIYSEGDAYMSVDTKDGLRLIERNCPFLNVATRRPALCSVTVSALQHLLGVRVVREERFQSGHGRCVFRVLADQPVDSRRFRFALESEK